MGERLLCKQDVASSILVTSTKFYAGLAQLVERNFAKVKVVGSNPISRSILWIHRLSVRTSGFHPEKRGSTPLGSSKY